MTAGTRRLAGGHWLIVACLAGPACSSSASASHEGTADGSAADSAAGTPGTLSSGERDAFEGGGASLTGLRRITLVVDAFFELDPTLDPTKTPQQNAAAIEARLTQSLADAGAPCGTVSVSGATVTAAFGPPPGCTLSNGVVVSGTAVATVTQAAGKTTVAFSFTSFTVDGTSLTGTASFATTNGTTFAVNAQLTYGTTTYTVTALTITGGSGTATMDGTVSAASGGTTTTLTLVKLVWKAGDCYPSSGSLKVTKGLVTTTVTFSATTASTGQVTVTVGRKTTPATLPAYGSCPA